MFRYECVPSAKFNGKEYFYWNMTISEHCCLHCDGTVYKSDSVIESVVAKDECGTTKTSVCRKNDDGMLSIQIILVKKAPLHSEAKASRDDFQSQWSLIEGLKDS